MRLQRAGGAGTGRVVDPPPDRVRIAPVGDHDQRLPGLVRQEQPGTEEPLVPPRELEDAELPEELGHDLFLARADRQLEQGLNALGPLIPYGARRAQASRPAASR